MRGAWKKILNHLPEFAGYVLWFPIVMFDAVATFHERRYILKKPNSLCALYVLDEILFVLRVTGS
jgi:hypothetical protein